MNYPAAEQLVSKEKTCPPTGGLKEIKKLSKKYDISSG